MTVRRPGHRPVRRRGAAIIAVVILLALANIVIIGLVVGGARDQDLAVRRIETVRAFYAAEAGMNMAIREIMQNADEDGDGGIGTISNDGDAGTDPSLDGATFSVTAVEAGSDTFIMSEGVSGEAHRSIRTTMSEE